MTATSNKRQLTGRIVSDKMNSTVIVEVESVQIHPKYKKRFKVTSRFVAHNEGNQFHTGDKVIIEESRPISKTKRWKAVKKI